MMIHSFTCNCAPTPPLPFCFCQVWIGERTRELDGAHVEFCRGVKNPVGVKISDKCVPDELLALLDAVNPGGSRDAV